MTVVTIKVDDATNPTEVQDWLNQNPLATISYIEVAGPIFYVFYT